MLENKSQFPEEENRKMKEPSGSLSKSKLMANIRLHICLLKTERPKTINLPPTPVYTSFQLIKSQLNLTQPN